MVHEIVRTSPLADYASGPYNVPESNSDEDVIAHNRQKHCRRLTTVGTCKMGTDELAVVDPSCACARGGAARGGRVGDAHRPRGNTNAPTIALAEKASDLIRA